MTTQHILQVSELTRKVRFILESEMNTVWLTGEISNFVAASSGHWYLSLKDSKSQVRCAMFKGNNRRVKLASKAQVGNGKQVLVRAKVSLYEPRGDFQLIIEHMEDAGEGLLRQQYEQLKNKLNALGLFDQHHKKLLPDVIKTIGVVTSPTGAAVKDILTVLKRRNPNINVIIYPALVQGDHASNDICHAIYLANLRQECDVLIVGRGGGSLEDLWSFNEETVVQSIYDSTIPIISAVGHEVDTTLSDYVADHRAATPSAAAEIVSSDSRELLMLMAKLKQRLIKTIANMHHALYIQHRHVQHRLTQVDPQQKIQLNQQKSDELDKRLTQAISRVMLNKQHKPLSIHQRLMQLSPNNAITERQESINQLTHRLNHAVENHLQHKSELFAHLIEQLHIVSPLATIARGYSVSRKSTGQIISTIAQVETAEEINVQVSDGILTAKVIATKPLTAN